MLRFELKKIFAKRSNKIAVFILSAAVIIVSCLTIGSIEYTDLSGNLHTGISANKELKKVKQEWAGYVTDDVLNKVIQANNEINSSENYLSKDIRENNIAFSQKQGFADIKEMINMSFSDFQEYDYYRADSVSPDQLHYFYPNRVNNLKNWLYSASITDNYTEQEKSYLIEKYEALEEPLYYEYSGSWTALLTYLPSLIMMIALIGTFLVSGIFSDEFRLKADAIFFSTNYGRNKAVKSKITAGFICVTAAYWIAVLAFSIIIFGSLGVSGADCMIQTGLGGWKSFYNLTFWQEYILTILGGYIGILFILLLAMLISAKTRSSVFAVTIPFILLLMPSFLSNFPTLSSICGILPDQLLQISSSINLFNLYQIGGLVIGAVPIVFVVYSLGYLLMLPLLYRIYRKSEVRA